MVRVQLPAAAPILHRLRVSTRPSLQNSAYSGQHGGSLPFSFRGRGRQAMHLLCKQVDVGALPTDSTILRLEPEQRAGSKRRMSSIGLAKEDFSKLWMAGQFQTAGNSTNAQRGAS